MKKLKKDELVRELEHEYASWDKAGRLNTRMGSAEFTDKLYPYKNLFSPIVYNELTARNKVVYIPEMGYEMQLKDGAPSDETSSFYIDRARGGTGLLCTAPIPVGTTAFTKGAWRELTEGVHSRGAVIFAQLDLESGRADPSSVLSADAVFTKLIKLAGQSAANAVASGFDGICLCGAAGSVLDKMSSKEWNRKLLGQFSDPCRFGCALTKEIRQRTSAGMPILYRIVLSHAVSESYGDTAMEHKELKSAVKQRSIADTLVYMEKLVEAGVDMFEVGMGCIETPWLIDPAAPMPAGCYLDAAKAVGDYFKAAEITASSGQRVCIIGSGKLDCPDIAEAALREKLCSAVSVGNAVSADGHWCEKAAAGKCDDIIPYYSPSEKCRFQIVPAPRKRVAVIGGGLRGMLYALEAARNGHRVDLYEKSSVLGGNLAALSRPSVNCAVRNYLSSLIKRVNECGNITVKTGINADADILRAGNYEELVFAVGKKPSVPSVPGWGEIPYASAADIMKHPEKLPDVAGKHIAVIGGAELGCACAWWLKSEKNCGRVTVIDSTPYIMEGSRESDRSWMIHYLELYGTELVTLAVPCKIQDGWLYYEEKAVGAKPEANATWTAPAPFENVSEEETLRCVRPDLIVLASEGDDSDILFVEAKSANIAPEIKMI